MAYLSNFFIIFIITEMNPITLPWHTIFLPFFIHPLSSFFLSLLSPLFPCFPPHSFHNLPLVLPFHNSLFVNIPRKQKLKNATSPSPKVQNAQQRLALCFLFYFSLRETRQVTCNLVSHWRRMEMHPMPVKD